MALRWSFLGATLRFHGAGAHAPGTDGADSGSRQDRPWESRGEHPGRVCLSRQGRLAVAIACPSARSVSRRVRGLARRSVKAWNRPLSTVRSFVVPSAMNAVHEGAYRGTLPAQEETTQLRRGQWIG